MAWVFYVTFALLSSVCSDNFLHEDVDFACTHSSRNVCMQIPNVYTHVYTPLVLWRTSGILFITVRNCLLNSIVSGIYITYTSSVCPQWNCLSLVFVHLTFCFSFYFVRLWANGFPMASRDGSCSDLLQAWLGFHCGIYPTWLLWWRHFDSDCYRVKQTSTLQV